MGQVEEEEAYIGNTSEANARSQLPRNCQLTGDRVDILKAYCSILFKTWMRSSTKKFSCDIVTLENFQQKFSEAWNSLIRQIHPPKIIRTFTLIVQHEKFIVLKYSVDDHNEQFIVMPQNLIQLIADLYDKHGDREGNEQILTSLMVNINLDKLPRLQSSDFLSNMLTNYPHGITFGPSVQQLFQCCVLPEIENPHILLGYLLVTNTAGYLEETGTDNSAGSLEALEKSQDEVQSSEPIEELTRSYTTLPHGIRTPNENRPDSPKETDIPTSVRPQAILGPKCVELRQNSCDFESAKIFVESRNESSKNLNPFALLSQKQLATVPDDSNRKCLGDDKNVEINSESVAIYRPDTANEHQSVQRYGRIFEKRILEMPMVAICCGMDSRYCNCYYNILTAYIPPQVNFEMAFIKFSRLTEDNWKVEFGKHTYHVSYQNFYKNGDILKAGKINGDKYATQRLSEFAEMNGHDYIDRRNFIMSIKTERFRKWVYGTGDLDDDESDDQILLVNQEHSNLNKLDEAAYIVKHEDMMGLLQYFCILILKPGDTEEPLDEIETSYEIATSNDRLESEESTPIEVEPDVTMFLDSEILADLFESEDYHQNGRLLVETNTVAVQTDLMDEFPFKIECIMEVHPPGSNSTTQNSENILYNPNIGFRKLLNANFAKRIELQQNSQELDSPKCTVHVNGDFSMCWLLKSNAGSAIQSSTSIAASTESNEIISDMGATQFQPFYLKKLRRSLITTIDDFPTTQVAKKKIGSIIEEAIPVLNLEDRPNIPILWIYSRTLALSSVYWQDSTDELHLILNKNDNRKYIINAMFFERSVNSKKISDIKFGTLDALPMEITHTKNIILKIEPYERPLLLIISDNCVWDSKVLEQCRALWHFENNRTTEIEPLSNENTNGGPVFVVEPNLVSEESQISDRAIRKCAIKPHNFYNESKERNRCESNESEKEKENTNGNSQYKPSMESQISYGDENDFSFYAEREIDSNNNSNNHQICEKISNSQSDRSTNKSVATVVNSRNTENLILKPGATLIKSSLPLQKKYALGQEKAREMRSRVDSMFLKVKYPMNRDPNIILSFVDNKVKILRRDRINRKNSNARQKLLNRKNSDSRLPKYNKSVDLLALAKRRPSLPAFKSNDTRNSLSNSPKAMAAKPNNENRFEKVQACNKSDDIYAMPTPKREQIFYNDLLTPQRIAGDEADFDLERFLTKGQANGEKRSENHTPNDKKRAPDKELILQKLLNPPMPSLDDDNGDLDATLLNHQITKEIQSGKSLSEISKIYLKFGSKESSQTNVIPQTDQNLNRTNNLSAGASYTVKFVNNELHIYPDPETFDLIRKMSSHTDGTDIDITHAVVANNQENLVNELADNASVSLSINDVIKQLLKPNESPVQGLPENPESKEENADIDENKLQNLSLTQLVLTYPKTSSDSVSDENLEKNRTIYKKILMEKLKENLRSTTTGSLQNYPLSEIRNQVVIDANGPLEQSTWNELNTTPDSDDGRLVIVEEEVSPVLQVDSRTTGILKPLKRRHSEVYAPQPRKQHIQSTKLTENQQLRQQIIDTALDLSQNVIISPEYERITPEPCHTINPELGPTTSQPSTSLNRTVRHAANSNNNKLPPHTPLSKTRRSTKTNPIPTENLLTMRFSPYSPRDHPISYREYPEISDKPVSLPARYPDLNHIPGNIQNVSFVPPTVPNVLHGRRSRINSLNKNPPETMTDVMHPSSNHLQQKHHHNHHPMQTTTRPTLTRPVTHQPSIAQIPTYYFNNNPTTAIPPNDIVSNIYRPFPYGLMGYDPRRIHPAYGFHNYPDYNMMMHPNPPHPSLEDNLQFQRRHSEFNTAANFLSVPRPGTQLPGYSSFHPYYMPENAYSRFDGNRLAPYPAVDQSFHMLKPSATLPHPVATSHGIPRPENASNRYFDIESSRHQNTNGINIDSGYRYPAQLQQPLPYHPQPVQRITSSSLPKPQPQMLGIHQPYPYYDYHKKPSM